MLRVSWTPASTDTPQIPSPGTSNTAWPSATLTGGEGGGGGAALQREDRLGLRRRHGDLAPAGQVALALDQHPGPAHRRLDVEAAVAGGAGPLPARQLDGGLAQGRATHHVDHLAG